MIIKIMSTCDLIMLHVNIIMLHVDINESHFNIAMFHVVIIYLNCGGQKCATIQNTYMGPIFDILEIAEFCCPYCWPNVEK